MDVEAHLPVPHSPPPSLKQKLTNCLCCFRHRHHHHRIDSPPAATDNKPTLIWVKTKPSHELSGDLKDKCKAILSRIGNPNKHRRHCSSAEFRYDPLSYSLNFEDGCCDDSLLDEAPLKNFSARLPPSP